MKCVRCGGDDRTQTVAQVDVVTITTNGVAVSRRDRLCRGCRAMALEAWRAVVGASRD